MIGLLLTATSFIRRCCEVFNLQFWPIATSYFKHFNQPGISHSTNTKNQSSLKRRIMKHQQVSVDYWAMLKAMLIYGALTVLVWLMLRLFNTVFTLPRRLRAQQDSLQNTLKELQRRYPDMNITEEDLINAEKELENITKEEEEKQKKEKEGNTATEKDKESTEPPEEDKKIK